MIADWGLQIEVDAFLSGWPKASQSKICILKLGTHPKGGSPQDKSKITELHHSSRLPQERKDH